MTREKFTFFWGDKGGADTILVGKGYMPTDAR